MFRNNTQFSLVVTMEMTWSPGLKMFRRFRKFQTLLNITQDPKSVVTVDFFSSLCHNKHERGGTARSRKDETRNGHQYANQNPRWSFQVSFRKAPLKRDMNFDHRGFRFAFRRAFRVSSSLQWAVAGVFFEAKYLSIFVVLFQKELFKYWKETLVD